MDAGNGVEVWKNCRVLKAGPKWKGKKMRLEELKSSRAKPSATGTLVCSKCGEKNADDGRICKSCKQGLYVNCAVCGQENLRARTRCSSCSHHLRTTWLRSAKKFFIEEHGMLLMKICLVAVVSVVATKVILKMAEVDAPEPKAKPAAAGENAAPPAVTPPPASAVPAVVAKPPGTTKPKPTVVGVTTPPGRPAADPNAPKKPLTPEEVIMDGWKARYCDVTITNGIVTMRGKGVPAKYAELYSGPFLILYAGQREGPGVIKFRVRSAGGGPGKVDILPGGNDTPLKEIRSVPFVTTGGDWQEISVLNSQSGPLGVVRLYLPADKQPVQVDWIELVSAGRYKRWDF